MREGFNPNDARTWNEEEYAVYEVGHQEGESCNAADWVFALDDVLPDDIAASPSSVGQYIQQLQAAIEGKEAL